MADGLLTLDEVEWGEVLGQEEEVRKKKRVEKKKKREKKVLGNHPMPQDGRPAGQG